MPTRKTELVLVGGGHTHVQVLRDLAMKPRPSTRVTVVLDQPVAVYSGMVPGFVAGQYAQHDLEIDVVPLARRAGARVVLSAAVGVDAQARRIDLDDRPSIPYDIASLDVGSTVAGIDLAGVRGNAMPSRPIAGFVQHVGERLSPGRASDREGVRVAVVGGGVGGVEIAFCLRERLCRGREGAKVEVTLIHDGDRILPGLPASLARRAERHAGELGVDVRCGTRVQRIEPGLLWTEDGGSLPFDLVAWVTGAVGHAFLRGGSLPLDERGFIRTRSSLQVVGFDDLFAVGDCATLETHPTTPKAGVYAVRQGPYLIHNLAAFPEGRPLRRYRPQSDFLALLNLGDGRAIGSKWGLSFEGDWIFRLKDRIDRRFMSRFQVLAADGAALPGVPEMESDEPMVCGGCAAKIGQPVLERALGRLEAPPRDDRVVLGLSGADDAAAWRTPSGDIVTTSVDLFSAFTDDPYLVGRVAALNAASDLLATGVEPGHALAIVALPEDLSPAAAEETLFQTLTGARRELDALGVTLLGGHTTTASKLMVGFSVEGTAGAETELYRLAGLQPGDALVLSKGIGTGVLFQADMRGFLPGRWLESAIDAVLRSNVSALATARAVGATALTDVTGFGLVGHLGEMLQASGVGARLELEAVPCLPGARELLERGIRSTFHEENAALRSSLLGGTAPRSSGTEILFDPQTSGGLLFGVDEGRAEEAVSRLHDAGDEDAAVVGRVLDRSRSGGVLEVDS